MAFSIFEKVLWAASFVGHAALLTILLWKRRVWQLPVFTVSIAYQMLVTIVDFLLSTHARPHTYYVWYWIFALGDYCFQVAVILEIAREVLRPTGTWIRDARRSFLLWSGTGLLVGAGLSLTLAPPGVTGLDLWEMRATVFTSLLACEMFLAMLVSANRLGLRWRSHVMALGQGLTAWGMIALLGDLAHVALGWDRPLAIVDQVREFAYLGMLVFWMVAFWLPERERAPLSDEMQDYLVALHQRVQYDLHSVSPYKKSSL